LLLYLHSLRALTFASSVSRRTPFDGTPPTHFYGELVKTDRGCEILRDSEHFDTFADVIEQHGEGGDLDEAYVMTLKSVLWAVVRRLLPLYYATPRTRS
jgi:rapamycin-insensitive companion of mTOR